MATLENGLEHGSAPPTAELAISGMDCANCARHVTEAIQSVPGVHSATVNLEVRQVAVCWSPGAGADLPSVIRAVEAAGYGAKALPAGAAPDHSEHQLSGWQSTLWIGVLGTLPLMVGEWFFDLGMQSWFRWFSFALAGMVQLFAGAQFYRGAWRQLRAGSSNMDTLVALGSTTAFGYSTWALLTGGSGHLYFMEAAAIITLISVGHWLEARMGARASSALKSLLNLAPPTARLRHPDGSETEISVAELKPGNLVILKPGDRVPTDGEAAEGDSAVDESMGTTCLEPGRDESKSLHAYQVDYLICCYAGHGQFDGKKIPYGMFSRTEAAFEAVFRKVQDATMNRLHLLKQAAHIKGFILPYLGQQDGVLPEQPPDLVRRNQVFGYPTNFAAMREEDIRLLSSRGEQLTRILLGHYCPEL